MPINFPDLLWRTDRVWRQTTAISPTCDGGEWTREERFVPMPGHSLPQCSHGFQRSEDV
jgi:hypothetical protein